MAVHFVHVVVTPTVFEPTSGPAVQPGQSGGTATVELASKQRVSVHPVGLASRARGAQPHLLRAVVVVAIQAQPTGGFGGARLLRSYRHARYRGMVESRPGRRAQRRRRAGSL